MSDRRTLRETPYTEAHRNSYIAKMQRADPPESLRELVRELRRAYTDEVPSRIHSRDTDAGGDPAWSPEFTRYIAGSDFATDRRDDGTTEVYVTPFRACLAAMDRGDEKLRIRAAVVSHIILGGVSPIEAAMEEGVPHGFAEHAAKDALRVFWRRFSDVRLDLRTLDRSGAVA